MTSKLYFFLFTVFLFGVGWNIASAVADNMRKKTLQQAQNDL
jgi:hypothetical protein